MAPPATIVAAQESGAFVLRPQGSWVVATAAELDSRLRALKLPQGGSALVDLADVDRLDTAGAWLLLRTEHALAARGNSVELSNVRASFAPLLAQLRMRSADAVVPPHPIPPHHTFVGFLARMGEESSGPETSDRIFGNVRHAAVARQTSLLTIVSVGKFCSVQSRERRFGSKPR